MPLSPPDPSLRPSEPGTPAVVGGGVRASIVQSGYLPWKGQFDLIHDADVHVFLDDVQFTLRDWRTRNRIKTERGAAWLSIPVGSHRELCIDEIVLENRQWQAEHWKTLRHTYGRAPHFNRYKAFFEDLYLDRRWASLSELNQYLTRTIAQEFLGIRTRFLDARPLGTQGRKTPRLLEILLKVGATTYFTGPTTRSYLDVEMLARHGIQAIFKDMDGYPEYPQAHPPFEHRVSIVDLLFNAGPEAPAYIWGWREGAK